MTMQSYASRSRYVHYPIGRDCGGIVFRSTPTRRRLYRGRVGHHGCGHRQLRVWFQVCLQHTKVVSAVALASSGDSGLTGFGPTRSLGKGLECLPQHGCPPGSPGRTDAGRNGRGSAPLLTDPALRRPLPRPLGLLPAPRDAATAARPASTPWRANPTGAHPPYFRKDPP